MNKNLICINIGVLFNNNFKNKIEIYSNRGWNEKLLILGK